MDKLLIIIAITVLMFGCKASKQTSMEEKETGSELAVSLCLETTKAASNTQASVLERQAVDEEIVIERFSKPDSTGQQYIEERVHTTRKATGEREEKTQVSETLETQKSDSACVASDFKSERCEGVKVEMAASGISLTSWVVAAILLLIIIIMVWKFKR